MPILKKRLNNAQVSTTIKIYLFFIKDKNILEFLLLCDLKKYFH